MKSTLKVCMSLFKIKVAEGFQYRMAGLAGATTSIFWGLIEIIVYTVFYKYADDKNAGIIAGLSLKQVVTYTWLTQMFFIMQPMNIDSEILKTITSGDVGIEMCRPLDLYYHWFSKTAATRLSPMLLRGLPVMLAGMLMPSSYRISLPDSLPGFLFMLISLISAFLLCTSFGMLVIAIRLNITWGDGPTYIIMLLGGVLSGAYLPLQLWPDFMQGFLIVQPFAGYLDIPVRLYLGTLPPEDAIWAIGMQIIWIGAFILAGKSLMSKRLKNIIVQGG